MIQTPVRASRRTLIGVALGLWIVLLCFLSLRASSAGPLWAFRLAATPDGRAIATSVEPNRIAWMSGLRDGDEVISIDHHQAAAFADDEVPSTVREVVFRDSDGLVHDFVFSDVSGSMLAFLIGGALFFVALGGIVYRWSSDAALGRAFLLLAASFATALATAPASRAGILVGNYLTPAAALTAASSLFLVFLLFPRHMRLARQLAVTSFAGSAVVFLGLVVEPFVDRRTDDAIDLAAWLWCVTSLLAAFSVLGVRLRRKSDRRALSPLAIGTLVAIAPLIVFVGLPRLLQLSGAVRPELAAVSMAAIPISFAYSILRHHMFGLDALMRIVLQRTCIVVCGSLAFAVAWYVLQACGLPPTEAALVSAAVCGLGMPSVSSWIMRRLDDWLYQPLAGARSGVAGAGEAGLDELGAVAAQRLRQLLPIQWAACVVHDDTTPVNSASRRVLGTDGQVPHWLDPRSTLEQNPTEVSVTPVHRFDTGVVLMLAGPRLDGSRLDRIQYDAMRVLARGVSARFEAGLLRERADDEASFRQGVTELSRDLAAAATVSDVLRAFSSHAARLLQADSASLRWRGSDGEPATDDRTEVTDNTLAFELDDGTDQAITCEVKRPSNAPRFGIREDRRARELAGHATGALRRAAEREVLEEQLRHRAFYDSLTGLPNRALFLDRIGHAMARAERLGQELAVLFVDLDRFKVVNDSLGHAAGDQLLVQVGRRLKSSLRDSDTIARLGGDEFTVLLEGASATSDAVRAAERILATLAGPFVLDGQDAYASASIGIAGGTAIRTSERDLLREADIALYRAKAGGRGRYEVFEARMSHSQADHLHLESDLHRAIERAELRVHYQPIFSLQTSEVSGLEALLRWEHPDKGMISPAQFIPVAEETGLIIPIGRWVLEEACRQMREWHDEFPAAKDMFVSVNLSLRQLQDPNLLDDIQRAVRESGIDPRCLQLEITESLVMQDPEAIVAKLEALKGLGIKLAVDDFGTGYSSLAYLKRFPIDVLKIDRSFVSGLVHGEHDAAIVQTVIGLAQALGLHTTAEGIEERSQWDRLEQLGCDQGQGFIFSRPLRPDAVRDMLQRPVDEPPLLAAA